MIGPTYTYPIIFTDGWESDNAFAGSTMAAAISYMRANTVYFAGTSTNAPTPPFRCRLTAVGWSMQYAADGGASTVYTLNFWKNGVIAATTPMAVPNVGLLPATNNVGGGKVWSAEVDLIPGTDVFGLSATLSAGTGASAGVSQIMLGFEVIGT